MKDELDLEISEDTLINLIELAIPEEKVEKPGETIPRCSQAREVVMSIFKSFCMR